MATVAVMHCPICGSGERNTLFVGHDRLHNLPGRFPVVRCLDCGGAYLAERPVDLTPYYPSESYAAFNGGKPHFSRAPGRGYGLAQRCRLLKTLKPEGGHLLDIGCGSGDFLAAMNKIPNWQVAGLEPNLPAAQYARTVHSLNVTTGELPQSNWPEAMYDVVTMWHVLEHLCNPRLALLEVNRLLKPNGICVLAVPVDDSMEARVFGKAWSGYDVPRHLTTFTRASLIQMLARSNFHAEEHVGTIQGFASLRLSLAWWFAERGLVDNWLYQLASLILFPGLYVYLRYYDGRRVSTGVFVANRFGRP